MTTFPEILGAAALAILVYVTLIWLLSLPLKNSGIIDVFWGPGFMLANGVALALGDNGFPARKRLVTALVCVWALRLAVYIFARNHGKGEDFRYRAWREANPKNWWRLSFFKVFLLQGVVMWIVALPLLAAQFSAAPSQLIWLDYFGAALWAVGFFFEAIGDAQMFRFKSNLANRGKLMNAGLWRYTRHPNYFGEATLWWGFFLFAAAAGAYWAILSPLLLTALLLKVSGVAMLESALQNTKPGYREYQQNTNAFLPWPPRKT
jgi:steroid 5-alpha reductase family enzyme